MTLADAIGRRMAQQAARPKRPQPLDAQEIAIYLGSARRAARPQTTKEQ